MKDKKKLQQPLRLYLVVLIAWMVCFGIFPVMYFFTSDKNDYTSLGISFLYIFIAYFVVLFATMLFGYIKEKFTMSEETQVIRINLKSLLGKKNVSRSLFFIVILSIASYLAIGSWGTTEIDKPFNRFDYEAIYEANLSKNPSLKNIERIEVWIKVENHPFHERKIILDYIYYNEKFDIDFDESDSPIYLHVGKFVPVEFDLDDKEYKWYIEMSNIKVSDYIYGN